MSEYIIHIEDAKAIYGNADFLFPLDAYLREEIVRCRDCKWMSKDTVHYKACYRLHTIEFMVEPDGFCSWGERE